jgi:class 3 adenylate cyclase
VRSHALLRIGYLGAPDRAGREHHGVALALPSGLWEGAPGVGRRTSSARVASRRSCSRDVEASTDIATRLGDDAAASLLATHNTIVLEQVAAYGGRDVRSTGDGFLVVFDSARAAVSCALSIQRELTEREHPI